MLLRATFRSLETPSKPRGGNPRDRSEIDIGSPMHIEKTLRPPPRFFATALATISLTAMTLAQIGCRPPEVPSARLHQIEVTGVAMGTSYSVKVVDAAQSLDRAALAEDVAECLETVNQQMSTYRDDSELSRFNAAAADQWFSLSPSTYRVLKEAEHTHEITGGAFDPTVGPLVKLWNFGPGRQATDRVPSDEQIATARAAVGMQHVELRAEPPAARKDLAAVYLDLSAIAKGYAVDQVAELLNAQGITDYMVEVGGEVRTRGHNAENLPWQIAIERPTSGSRTIQRVIAMRDRALATSGDYRNYFEIEGARYCHILDPRSGRPVSHRLASVSVLSDSCMTADALATALFVLGPEEAFAWAKRENLAVLLLVKSDHGFDEWVTPAMQKALE